jgi:hypothetical protein
MSTDIGSPRNSTGSWARTTADESTMPDRVNHSDR